VPLVPIATFLAGSLLTLLLPTIMLTALVVWYIHFLRRVPEPVSEPTDGSPPGPPESPTDVPAAADNPSGERP
jgi:hypothetical protein